MKTKLFSNRRSLTKNTDRAKKNVHSKAVGLSNQFCDVNGVNKSRKGVDGVVNANNGVGTRSAKNEGENENDGGGVRHGNTRKGIKNEDGGRIAKNGGGNGNDGGGIRNAKNGVGLKNKGGGRIAKNGGRNRNDGVGIKHGNTRGGTKNAKNEGVMINEKNEDGIRNAKNGGFLKSENSEPKGSTKEKFVFSKLVNEDFNSKLYKQRKIGKKKKLEAVLVKKGVSTNIKSYEKTIDQTYRDAISKLNGAKVYDDPLVAKRIVKKLNYKKKKSAVNWKQRKNVNKK